MPVGLTNAHHEPLNYFTVYRPEGEATILPCTWHDTGLSIWGRSGDFRYEAQVVAGLDAFMFNRENWVQKGAGSAYEFKVANKYGFVARVDNYTVPGLRIGVSGYYGKAMHNSFPHELEGKDENNNVKTYDHVKGNVAIGSVDFTFNKYNIVARGSVDYGYVGNAQTISSIKRNLAANNSNYQKTPVGKNALAIAFEAGYDVFSQIESMRQKEQKLLCLDTTNTTTLIFKLRCRRPTIIPRRLEWHSDLIITRYHKSRSRPSIRSVSSNRSTTTSLRFRLA